MRVYLYKNAVRDCYRDRSSDRPIAEATLTLTKAMRRDLRIGDAGDIWINGHRLLPSWVGLERPCTDVVPNVPTTYPIARPCAWTWWRDARRRERRADITEYDYSVANSA